MPDKYEHGFHNPTGTWGVRIVVTGRYVQKGIATNTKAARAASVLNAQEMPDYPAEAAEIARRGGHPDEANPRGVTFIHERDNWMREVERLTAYAQTLQQGVRELLEKACALVDGLQGWFFRCRHCGGRSPEVGLKSQANQEHVEHKPDCAVVRLTLAAGPEGEQT